MTKQDIQNYKDNRNLEKGFNTYWNKGFDEAIAFVNKRQEAINYTHSCETLEVFEEIVFEDWLKQHRFTKDINHYIKNNITYREWEVFNMYTMDVYNL